VEGQPESSLYSKRVELSDIQQSTLVVSALLVAYAEWFTATGMAVLAFNYRHPEISGGEVCHLIDILHQLYER